MIMTIIYTLVGIIALCGVIGIYLFAITKMLANDLDDNPMKDQKHIDFINNYEYCPKENNNA